MHPDPHCTLAALEETLRRAQRELDGFSSGAVESAEPALVAAIGQCGDLAVCLSDEEEIQRLTIQQRSDLHRRVAGFRNHWAEQVRLVGALWRLRREVFDQRQPEVNGYTSAGTGRRDGAAQSLAMDG